MAIDINNYKFYVRDLSISDNDLGKIINTVINDIAKTSKIFKKMIGFSIIKDINEYDFDLLLKINNYIRKDVSSVTITDATDEDILSFLSNYNGDNNLMDFSNGIDILYETEDSKITETLLEVYDVVIYDSTNKIQSVFNLFSYISGFKYHVTDFSFINSNKNYTQAVAICSVIPDINTISDDMIKKIEPALIEGIKYFTQSPYTNPNDVQSVSVLLQRYNYEKGQLMNLQPILSSKLTKKAWL